MKKADPSNSARRLRMLTSIVFKLSRRDLEKKLKARKIDISPLGFWVLKSLNKEGCTLAKLSSRMMLHSATLIPVIDALEKKGLIKREKDPKDRRVCPLSVTLKAKKLISEFPLFANKDVLSEALKKIGNIKTQQVLSVMEELAKALATDKKTKENVKRILLHKE